ncbi:unnamed protein product, partial [Discosporangium mesarthrocarpum]
TREQGEAKTVTHGGWDTRMRHPAVTFQHPQAGAVVPARTVTTVSGASRAVNGVKEVPVGRGSGSDYSGSGSQHGDSRVPPPPAAGAGAHAHGHLEVQRLSNGHSMRHKDPKGAWGEPHKEQEGPCGRGLGCYSKKAAATGKHGVIPLPPVPKEGGSSLGAPGAMGPCEPWEGRHHNHHHHHHHQNGSLVGSQQAGHGAATQGGGAGWAADPVYSHPTNKNNKNNIGNHGSSRETKVRKRHAVDVSSTGVSSSFSSCSSPSVMSSNTGDTYTMEAAAGGGGKSVSRVSAVSSSSLRSSIPWVG